MKQFTAFFIFFVSVSAHLAAAQPEVGKALEDYFSLPGLDCPTYAEVEDNPAVKWAVQHLPQKDIGPALVRMANSSDLRERQIYFLLHQAFSLREAPPEAQESEAWPTQRKLDEIDYLIVGSGPAGSVLAYELSRAGFRTMVIERGPLVRPNSVDTRALGFLKVGGGAVPTEDSFLLLRNGQTVGGGATVNVDLAFSPTLPMVRRRLESWNLAGFSPERVAEAYSWVQLKIGTRTPSLAEINRNNQLLLDGAKALNLTPTLYELNTRPPGEKVGLANDKLGPAERLLREALLADFPLQILWDLEVKRVLVEDGRAVGVEVESRETPNHPAVEPPWPSTKRVLKAKNVILSAGTLGSATVLLRSGVGGPNVGKGVLLHPSMPLIGHFDHHINVLDGTTATVYASDPKRPYLLYECMAAGPDYASIMLFGTAPERASLVKDYPRLGGFGVLLVDEPHPDNRIEIDSAGNPKVYYQLRGKDKERLQASVSQGMEMLFAAGANSVYLPTTEPLDGSETWNGHIQPVVEPKKVDFVSGRTVVTSAHMQGSCKMGHSREHSVVGPDFKVWGYDNLYVCDSSVFPTSVGANPMQTVYTTAKILADELTKKSVRQ